jgi:ABC-type nitrate/sulfonate/bicarbonate transport system substrate-binding protein
MSCTAMDVAGWLRGLGLEQYEANFRDNKVDAAVLPQLTADELKDIGVAAVVALGRRSFLHIEVDRVASTFM